MELVTQAGGAGTGAGTGTPPLTARYRYSSAGQRYHTAYTGSEAEHYALDGAETIGVFTASGELRYWNAAGAGRHLADGSRRYYLTDHLGSVRTVVDGTGSPVEARDYYPYGLELPGRTTQASPPTKEGFTGHEKDQATGLVYAGARYYMPAIPRWTAVDPLADEFPAWSPYNYTLGSPVITVDPDGMAPQDIYISESGQYLGEDGASTDDVRIISEDDFASISSQHGGSGSAAATTALQSASQVVTVDEAQIASEVQGITDVTRQTGVEHSAIITLNPETATVSALPGPSGTNSETPIVTVPNGDGLPLYVGPNGESSFQVSGGALFVVGQVHGHPQVQQAGRRNVAGVSGKDAKTAAGLGVPVYATDAWRGRAGSTVRIHRANPDGSTSKNVGRTSGYGNPTFRLGTDALTRSVNIRRK